MKDKKKNFIPNEFYKGLFLIVLYLGSTLIFSALISGVNSTTLRNVYQLIYQIALATTFILIFKDTIISSFKNFKKENLKIIIVYWFLGFLAMCFFNFIINGIINSGGLSANEEGVRNAISISPLFMFFSVSIFAPIVEELTFRAGFKKAFLNPKTYCIVSGLAFGAMHLIASFNPGYNWIQLLYILPYASLGVAFAYIYTKTDNVICPIIAHCIHNTLTISLILLLNGVM